jgi:hypothetical protein
MPYDAGLATRIRDLLTDTPGLVERKMFGALGFTINGRASASAYKTGELMVSCNRADWPAWVTEPGARPLERGAKPVSGWVLVANEAVEDDAELEKWVQRGRAWALAQPPK